MFKFSAQDISEYNRTGVVVCEGLFTRDQRDQILSEIDAFVQKNGQSLDTRSVHWVKTPDGRQIPASLHHLEGVEFFRSFCASDAIVNAARDLLADEPVLMNCQYFGKPAEIGRAVPIHQDNAYFHLEPCNALSFWLSIDDADLDNGCVKYLAETQKLGDLPHQLSNVPGSSQTLVSPEQYFSRHDTILGKVNSGGFIAHHFQTIHWSDPNKSTRPRRSLVLTFRGQKCSQNKETHEKYLRDLSRNAV